MYKIYTDKKDWQLAQELFGVNDNETCRMIKKLRKQILEIIEETADWSAVSIKNTDEIALIIPTKYLKDIL